MMLGSGSMAGRYRLIELVGRGGMGVVFSAEDTELGRTVAVKLLAPQLAVDPSFVDRFRREARLAAGLRHPNIVVVHDWGMQDGQPFLVMELLEGRSLKELVEESGRLPLERAVRLSGQCADALQYAHSLGLVHRDVKPGNIMVGPTDRAVLTDFGIARASSGPQLTSVGGIIGTPEYLSPEQAMGRLVDGRSDLYSLGIVLYEMLAGRTPFAADSTPAVLHMQAFSPPPPLSEIRPDLPPAVTAVVERALAKDPTQRFASLEEFGQALRAAVAPGAADPSRDETRLDQTALLPAAAPRPTPRPPTTVSAPRGRFAWGPIAGGVAAAALVLGLGARFGLGIGAPAPTPRPTAGPAAAAPTTAPTSQPAIAATSQPTVAPTSALAAPATPVPTPPPTAPPPPPTAPPSPTPNPSLALVREADGLLEQDLNAAIVKYRQALALDADNPIASRQLGIALWLQGRGEEASRHFEKATRSNPGDAVAWAYLSAATADVYQYDRSALAAAYAAKTDPAVAESHAAEALQYLYQSDYKGARSELAEAVKLNPNSELVRIMAIRVPTDDMDWDSSLAVARQFSVERPHWAVSHLHYGYQLYLKNLYDEARRRYETALKTDPQTLGVHAALGDLLQTTERYDEADQAYTTELQRDSRNAGAMSGLGWVAYYKGDYAAAVEHFRRAIQLDPRSSGSYIGVCRSLSEGFQQHLEAEANCRKASELGAKNANAVHSLGLVQYNRGDYGAALVSFRAAAELEPASPYPRLWAGWALMGLGRLAEARAELEQASARKPDDAGITEAFTELAARGG